jgi:hypothetical protein
MILTLRWRTPERPVATRWRGPEGMLAAVTRNPSLPIAAIIGTSGAAPTRFDQAAAGTWIIAHGLGRVPIVQIFDPSGNVILTDVVADSSLLTITFATPQAGFVLVS